MKNFQYSTVIIFIFFFLVIGCKKDNDIPPVKHEKGNWLLSKVYVTTIGGNSPSPVHLDKEYIYNSQQRPLLDISYNEGHDTTRLDSLFYDNQNRLSRMSMVSFPYGGAARTGYTIKTIHYAADGKIDTIKLLNPAIVNPLLYVMTYKYQGAVVMEYVYSGGSNKPFVDSFRYTYDNDNLAEWRNFEDLKFPPPFNPPPEVYRYSFYDDCYSVFSYLNMNVYLPSLICNNCSGFKNYYNEPILSKNNYFVSQIVQTEFYSSSEATDFPSATTYEYTKDSTGLVLGKVVRSPGSPVTTTYSYEYIPK